MPHEKIFTFHVLHEHEFHNHRFSLFLGHIKDFENFRFTES